MRTVKPLAMAPDCSRRGTRSIVQRSVGRVVSNGTLPMANRRRAARFLELAQKLNDPDRRAKAIDLAIKWMMRARLASQSERPVVQQQQQIRLDNVNC
jgi:hypothetical protein